VKRVWLRRLTWCVAIGTGLILVIAAGIAWNLNSLVRRGIRLSLERQTGVGIRLDRAELGVRDGSFLLQSLVLSNPPGFGPGPLLSLPELFLRYDAGAASSNVFRLAEARVHLAEINIIVDREGRTNLMALATGSSTTRSVTPVEFSANLLRGMDFGGIDQLILTLGKLTVRDERDARRNRLFDLAITNRTFTNVTSLVQFLPLVLEIALKSGGQFGLPLSPLTNSVPIR